MMDRLQAHMEAMQRFSRAQDVTANNLANINTPGFKGDKLFQQLLTEQVDGETTTHAASMLQVALEQGQLEPTGNTFDFAIDGKGFFVVEDEGQTHLTRNGRFHLDADGYLRTESGSHVMGRGGNIHIPEYFHALNNEQGEARLEVAKDGTIRLNDEVYDQLRVVSVDDPASLQRRGSSYFAISDSVVMPSQDTDSTIMQGHYEKGNVQPLSEMTDLMRNMQMFEAQQRAMRTTDEMMSQATNSLGRF